MQTDGTIPNNNPDIIIRDNGKGTYMLMAKMLLRKKLRRL